MSYIYFIIYVIGVILTIVLEAYITVKFDMDKDMLQEIIVLYGILALCWPITLPVCLIVFACISIWKIAIDYFERVVKNRIKS
jgi:hypothetical protein